MGLKRPGESSKDRGSPQKTGGVLKRPGGFSCTLPNSAIRQLPISTNEVTQGPFFEAEAG